MTAKKKRELVPPSEPSRPWNKGVRRGDYQYLDGKGWIGFARFVVRFEGDKHDNAEGYANFNLALAAPDMLEVLEEVLEDLENDEADSTWLQSRVRAAINKARGR